MHRISSYLKKYVLEKLEYFSIVVKVFHRKKEYVKIRFKTI